MPFTAQHVGTAAQHVDLDSKPPADKQPHPHLLLALPVLVRPLRGVQRVVVALERLQVDAVGARKADDDAAALLWVGVVWIGLGWLGLVLLISAGSFLWVGGCSATLLSTCLSPPKHEAPARPQPATQTRRSPGTPCTGRTPATPPPSATARPQGRSRPPPTAAAPGSTRAAATGPGRRRRLPRRTRRGAAALPRTARVAGGAPRGW